VNVLRRIAKLGLLAALVAAFAAAASRRPMPTVGGTVRMDTVGTIRADRSLGLVFDTVRPRPEYERGRTETSTLRSTMTRARQAIQHLPTAVLSYTCRNEMLG
jgi:hypothetical protein